MRRTRFTQLLTVGALASVLVAGTAVAESTNSVTFEGWANDTAVKYNGRIPRDVYLDEMSRRWDADKMHSGTRDAYLTDLRTRWQAADPDNRGLTPAEISRFSGKVDSPMSAMPRSGSGTQPGNMGPGNTKGQ